MMVKVLPTELYVGVKDRSITQPRVILITLCLPLNGVIFEASEPYTSIRTLTYPLRFITWGTREIDVFFFVCTRKRFFKRNVRSEVRTRDP